MRDSERECVCMCERENEIERDVDKKRKKTFELKNSLSFARALVTIYNPHPPFCYLAVSRITISQS